MSSFSDSLNQLTNPIKYTTASGFSLDVFNDPILALSNFKPDYYDLILVDVKMPKMSGFEQYQEIKKKDDKAKAVYVL